jgi:hypothetical protein
MGSKKEDSPQRFLSSPQFSDFVDERHIVRDGNGSQYGDDEQHDEEFRKGKTFKFVR